MIFLKNDYSVCAHPAVLDELVKNNLVYSDSYCNDDRCEKTADLVREQIGDPDAAIHYIIGGTLVNLTCLAAFLKPYEAVITTVEGHIAVHETGAVEATGHRLLEVPTVDGKLDSADVDRICAIHNMDQMVVPLLRASDACHTDHLIVFPSVALCQIAISNNRLDSECLAN